ncbi:MAG TPA: transposase [Thermaerobacter sp.]
MPMSLPSRREYLAQMRQRYRAAPSRRERSQILDEVQRVCGYHRKYAIRVLNQAAPAPAGPRCRSRRRLYDEALPAIALAWEALDFPCAERLHPVLLPTAERLAAHGELVLTDDIRRALSRISRATLARRLAEMPSPKPRRRLPRPKPGLLRNEIPVGTYAWDEARPGALEVDLVEHNGGSTAGHYAYTLSVVDIVTGWSRRQAILGRGQRVVHAALTDLLADWPYPVWALHTDNGPEFANHLLLRYTQQHGLEFTRSRPYRKNDNAHVEQRNRQLVREMVGYARYDRPQQVEQLNRLYRCLDLYANVFLPTRKLVGKVRDGSRVRKTYDAARTPLQRVLERGLLTRETQTQ